MKPVRFGSNDFYGRWSSNDHTVAYDRPPTEPWQGMPIGDGRLGAMVWVGAGVVLQLNHADGFDGSGELPGISRLAVEVPGYDLRRAGTFSQQLRTHHGNIIIHGDEDIQLQVRSHPGSHLELICSGRAIRGAGVLVYPQPWRSTTQYAMRDNIIVLWERNTYSEVTDLNRRSGIPSEEIGRFGDPLLGRVTGLGIAVVDGAVEGPLEPRIRTRGETRVLLAAEVGADGADGIIAELRDRLRRLSSVPSQKRDAAQRHWWDRFWSRSWIEIGPGSDVGQGGLSDPATAERSVAAAGRSAATGRSTRSPAHALQSAVAVWHLNRYLAACSMSANGRNTFGVAPLPPKFNGGPFLYNWDRRSWGGPYWFQNTRLQYWPLIRSGDFDLVLPLFDMYREALPFARARVNHLYGHKGAVFLETMHFWGAGRREDVGPGGSVTNPYIRRYFTGSLELVMLMLAFARTSGAEPGFYREYLFPIADEVFAFFFEHFPRRSGKLYLKDSQALETWWHADNPADQIAGLKATLHSIVSLRREFVPEGQRAQRYASYLEQLPELPQGGRFWKPDASPAPLAGSVGARWVSPSAGDLLIPAECVAGSAEGSTDEGRGGPVKQNFEDPELYAVFPFPLVSAESSARWLSIARRTYAERIHKRPVYGWSQTGIWAARLGLAEEAAAVLGDHVAEAAVFPSGLMKSPGMSLPDVPGVPEIPYLDAPGAVATAVGEMLIQDHGGVVRRRPAWPEGVPVAYRLWAAGAPVSSE